MTTFTAAAYLNCTSGYRDADVTRDLFVALAECQDYLVEADTFEQAAELMFVVGNRMKPYRFEWPSHIRSLSAGDLVRLTDPSGFSKTLACQSVGWTDVSLRLDDSHIIREPLRARMMAEHFNVCSAPSRRITREV